MAPPLRAQGEPPLPGEQLWLELPPMSNATPSRLLVFLHGAGSSPEAFVPVALAWQLKFPGATAAVVEALQPASAGDGKDWYDGRGPGIDHEARITVAADSVAQRIRALQAQAGLGPGSTVLVGYSQGANVALELARTAEPVATIVVAYAARLSRSLREGEAPGATIHLIHGELDTVVPTSQAERAYRQLQAAGADVSLDIALDHGHFIGQGMINLGTTRVMQTLFRGRRPNRHPASSTRSEKLQ